MRVFVSIMALMACLLMGAAGRADHELKFHSRFWADAAGNHAPWSNLGWRWGLNVPAVLFRHPSVGWRFGWRNALAPSPQLDEPRDDEALAVARENRLRKVAGRLSLGGAGVVVAGFVVGIVALRKDKKIKNNCHLGECPEAYRDTLESRDGLALAADVLYGLGSAALVAGIATLLVARKKSLRTTRARPIRFE